jgi:hypothetical protein
MILSVKNVTLSVKNVKVLNLAVFLVLTLFQEIILFKVVLKLVLVIKVFMRIIQIYVLLVILGAKLVS